MARMIIAAAVATLFSLPPAFAQDAMMTNSQFLAASNCLAHAQLEQLAADAPNVDALRDAVSDNARRVDEPISAEAESRERALERSARRGQKSADELRADRDRICAPFVQSGLVRTGGAS